MCPDTGDAIAFRTLQTIAQLRPPGKALLPNLRKFTYVARNLSHLDALSQFLLFLGPSVVELKLLEIPSKAVPDLLEYLSQRAPQVQHLQVEAPPKAYFAASSAFASSLIQLAELTSLEAMRTTLTPALWDAMAQHPSLVSAGFSLAIPFDATRFQPRVFAKLSSLEIRVAKFECLCGLFESQNDLPTLIRVSCLGRSEDPGRSDFRQLCELLSQKLPRLACVELGFRTPLSVDAVPLRFEDFQSLLQCKTMQHFRLEHPCGVSVTTSEVSEILGAWPRIDTFALQYATSSKRTRWSRYALKWTPPTLPLSVLDTVVAKAPKIKELRLVLDATAPIDSTPGICQHQFEGLQELEVALSTVGHPGNVASYLSQRCKTRFSLKFVPPWGVQDVMVQTIDEEKKKWHQVEEHLRLLFDQRERLEEEFKRRLDEYTRARDVVAPTTSTS